MILNLHSLGFRLSAILDFANFSHDFYVKSCFFYVVSPKNLPGVLRLVASQKIHPYEKVRNFVTWMLLFVLVPSTKTVGILLKYIFHAP